MSAPVRRTVSRRLGLIAVCTLLFLTFLDNTIVSVALGDIQSRLSAGVQSLQWVVNAYALTFASAMLLAGALGDKIGQRGVMFAGAGVFCAGSVICAVAPDTTVLVAGRAVMGLGAAASEPGTLAMIRYMYPVRGERARATGVWAAVSGLALALGPVIGGIIVGLSDWRWIFWFNLFFGVVAVSIAAVVVPPVPSTRGRRIDLVGGLLGAGSLALLVFGVLRGEVDGFGAWHVVVLLGACVVLAFVFLWWQFHASEPLIPPRFLRTGAFVVPNIVAFATYFGTFAVFFFAALYLNIVVGYGGLRIALQFIPMMTVMIVASLLTGRWIARTGARRPVAFGCLVFAIGLLLSDATLTRHPSYVPLAASLALTGLGIGITVVPTAFEAMSAVPVDRAGMASSAVNTSREIGAVTGTAILGAIVNAGLVSHATTALDALGWSNLKDFVVSAILNGGASLGGPLSQASPEIQKLVDTLYDAFGQGLHTALVLSASLVFLAGVLAVAARGRRPAEQETEETALGHLHLPS
ncbi:MAG: MFS transporter [Acidothermus sp.]|nr:MFS transporter [Acidothermus sp.]